MTALLAGVDFTIPTPDLSGTEFSIPDVDTLPDPTELTNDLLTTGTVGGTGTFDKVMASIMAHMGAEYDKGRITGEQLTKFYIESVPAVLGNSVQFLLGKDTAYWQAIGAQQNAKIAMAQFVTARVQLEIAKTELASKQYEAKNMEANYALTKMKLSTESIAYCVQKYNLDEILPAQLEALTDAHNISVYNLANILPAQKTLVTEQMEAQRAQTMNTRSDGATTIVGVMGKQKDLYTQQIDSYKRDAETKALKLFTDAWITQKTIDEGLLPPGQFSNANLDVMLNRIRVNLSLAS
jgi:hypothetical protein